MHSPRMPNLFIVGAPKSGTTALSRYLSAHPDVFMSEQAGIKEPEYYARDFRFGGTVLDEKTDYLALFQGAPPHVRYLGEASVSYLHSQVAIGGILADTPSAKLIVMVRSPLEIAQRLHNQRVKHATETVQDFERAWHLQESRLNGPSFKSAFRDGRLFQYGDLSRIGSQLERLFDTAPQNQVHVIVYEDFVKDAGAVYQTLCEFLNIESNGLSSFPVVNPSHYYRISWLQKSLAWGRAARELVGLPGGVGLHRMIDRLNSRPGAKELRPEFKNELRAYFAREVEIASRVLERDLSHWLR